ncbi:hypothetical protein TNCV_5078261 [Trichonephila clavipes]|uniref:Uncharacterized protein n=1 Tax=Trichonephila clavipes TaxID=2585209 RepID=A0A8X6RYX6_TRICX|nr:hypothetical protein TNCV_5078261 [Trichonephila clavipes]
MYLTGENSNKRGSEEENDSTKKIKTIAKKYPKGSKIKYYDRFRRQIRHQQRLRGYLHLYLGTPTVMGETYDWTIKYYPRDNLKDPLENEMKIDTWKLVILENKPAERPTSKTLLEKKSLKVGFIKVLQSNNSPENFPWHCLHLVNKE